MKSQPKIQDVVQQIKSDIDLIASQTKGLKNGERFSQIKRMNELKQIATTLEDIDNSLNNLIEEQARKKSGSSS
uniref:Uncharacterized protein n=1 Tax=Roseihalotalea indica TaxID=2867963 RepID=A0AA49JK62_9BACT|nr:hypothetical protein K4G66_15795 [Tunicatimonas sp. TK19036]